MPHARETALDLKAFTSALRRSLWPVLLATAIGGGATFGVLSAIPAQYKAEARVVMDAADAPLAPRGSTRAATSILTDEHAIFAQIEVLRSREIADAVLGRPGLAARLASAGEMGFPALDSLLALASLSERTDAQPTAAFAAGKAFDLYQQSLTVLPIPRSRVIAIEFQASDPQLAADVANAVAQAFTARAGHGEGLTGPMSQEWLEHEAETLRASIAVAEAKVEEYRTRSGFAAAQNAAARLSDITAELSRATADRSNVEARTTSIRAALKEGGSLYSAGEVLNSPLFERLREAQRETRAQIADLSSFLPRRHPRIAVLMGRLDEIDGEIRREAQKALALLDTAVRAAEAREQALAQSLEETKAVAARANGSSVELAALERVAKAQRDLLTPVLARYREAAADLSAKVSSASGIVALAVAPVGSFFPRVGAWSLAAAVGVFLLGSTVAAVCAFTSGGILRPIDPPATVSVPLRTARRTGGARLQEKSAKPVAATGWTVREKEGAAAFLRPAARTAPPAGRFAQEHRDEAVSRKRTFDARRFAATAEETGMVSPTSRLGARESDERDAPQSAEVVSSAKIDGRPTQRVTLVIESLGESYEKVTMVADDLEWSTGRERLQPVMLDMEARVAQGEGHPHSTKAIACHTLPPDRRGKAA